MDIAPGCLFIEEAGGTVTDFTGAPWSLYSKNIVAKDENHAAALQIIQAALT